MLKFFVAPLAYKNAGKADIHEMQAIIHKTPSAHKMHVLTMVEAASSKQLYARQQLVQTGNKSCKSMPDWCQEK